MSAKPFELVQRAYESWFEAAGAMQSQAIEFLNDRLATDSAAIAKLAHCWTPLGILGVQADYAGRAVADFVTEAQRIAAWFTREQEGVSSPRVEPGSKEGEVSHGRRMNRISRR